MNKKLIQSFIILAMLVGMFATTGAAFAASSCGTSVTVVSGDTLRKIAERCGTTVSALQRANPEVGNGNLIYPGQNLLLPGTILGTDGGYVIYSVATNLQDDGGKSDPKAPAKLQADWVWSVPGK